jgi:glutaredoxin
MKPFKQISLLACLMCLGALAHAQTVYRIVGADGKVTFSDKPPVTTEQAKVAATTSAAPGGASGGALPFELRQVVAKYPVTLYSGADCGPCNSGRTLLNSRGVPFSERSVTTAEDIESLQRLTGETSLPFLSIGSQRIKGFSDAEWTQYLDAAGYPRVSTLPSGYRNPPASPLVTVQKPVAAKVEEKPPVAPEPVSPSRPGPSNPAGIQF